MQAYFAIFGSVSVPILMACLFGYLYQAFKSPGRP